MREYKMRRGEQLSERVPDVESFIEEYFGPVTGTEEHEGDDLYVVEEPANPIFERIVAGTAQYSSKKDRLAVEFEERDPTELDPDQLDAAEEAVSLKNDFLEEATGRDAKARRDSMKRDAEGDTDDVPEA
jgi:hypothetical protein